jgi:hypothetical protein
MEGWKNGIMEEWITGKMREPGAKLNLSSFHHSNIPIFQHSNNPDLHHSSFPTNNQEDLNE